MTPPQGAPERAGRGRGSDDPWRVIPDFHPFGRPALQAAVGEPEAEGATRSCPDTAVCARQGLPTGGSDRPALSPAPRTPPRPPTHTRTVTPARALATVRMAAEGAAGAPRPRSPEGRSRARPTARWPADGAALTMVLARPGAARAPQSSAGFSRRYRRLKLISAVGGPGKQRSSPRRTDQWTRAGGPHLPALRHAQQHSHWSDA